MAVIYHNIKFRITLILINDYFNRTDEVTHDYFYPNKKVSYVFSLDMFHPVDLMPNCATAKRYQTDKIRLNLIILWFYRLTDIGF